VIVTQHMDGVRQAALELMVESLGAEDVERQLDNLRAQDADEETLAKVMPMRTMADGFYDFAGYILWIRGLIDSNVEIPIMADEAEGLRALAAAQQEFERDHPACPQCGTRQYSSTAMRCRKSRCGMDFRKSR
jgi:NADH pyrophosphatase NudC (nudix superfamily)